jgi:malonate decarboxylase epsilon subunit
MAAVADQLGSVVTNLQIRTPRLAYVGNRRARVLRSAVEIAEELSTNVSHTVLEYDSVSLLYELGERVFIEAPPGVILTRLLVSTFKDVVAHVAAQTPFEALVHLDDTSPVAETPY